MFEQSTKSPAMILNELAVKKKYSGPTYVLTMSRINKNETIFYMEVNVANVCGMGCGTLKQAAKHRAAIQALKVLAAQGLYNPSQNPTHEFKEKNTVDFVGLLRGLCAKLRRPYPVFKEILAVGHPHCRRYTYECKSITIITQGTASTKKHAKQIAAKDMLAQIKKYFPVVEE